MAGLSSNALTLLDWAKRLDPDGRVSAVAELLSQTNEVLSDMIWLPGNLETGHRTTVRTGLPNVAWRLINQGVQPSKSTTAQVDEACGMLEAWSEVDVELAKLNGDINAFRLSEASAFVEAMNQEFSSTLFYGNSGTAPEEFTGLSIRYSDPSAVNGSNVIDAGSSDTDNTSIWLICWSPTTIHGIFPKHSKAGLNHQDLAEQTIQTSTAVAGTRLRVFQEKWDWKCGVALRDWRFAVRIGSIDVSNLVGKSSAADLVELMIKAIYRLPVLGLGKTVFYMNRTVLQMLDIQRRDDMLNGGIVYKEIDGISMPTFRNIPIRVCDALLNTESAV